MVDFEKSLTDNQRSMHGWAVMHRAFLEHNIIAISASFTNMPLIQLARLLGIDEVQVRSLIRFLVK